MISYSSVTDASVGKMFMGGIVPGLLMGVAMMIVAVNYGIRHKEVKRTKFSWGNLGRKFVRAILFVITYIPDIVMWLPSLMK